MTAFALQDDAEASHVSVQAAPAAVFLRLRRECDGEVRRRMFVELTLAEAIALRRELHACIDVAAASAGG